MKKPCFVGIDDEIGASARPEVHSSIGLDGVRRYRKKPVEIKAVLFNDPGVARSFCPGIVVQMMNNRWVGKINTLEGVMTANEGDFIIKGVKGEFYPCKPDIFRATYEAV